MPTTYKENREFIESVLPRDLLEQSMNWIGNNMVPEDVFTSDKLKQWAEETGVDKVFSQNDLEEWAEYHGFVLSATDERAT